MKKFTIKPIQSKIEGLPNFVIQGLQKGNQDVIAGRIITFEDFKKRRAVKE